MTVDGVTVVLAQKEHLAELAALERICFSEPWSENALGLFLATIAIAHLLAILLAGGHLSCFPFTKAVGMHRCFIVL